MDKQILKASRVIEKAMVNDVFLYDFEQYELSTPEFTEAYLELRDAHLNSYYALLKDDVWFLGDDAGEPIIALPAEAAENAQKLATMIFEQHYSDEIEAAREENEYWNWVDNSASTAAARARIYSF